MCFIDRSTLLFQPWDISKSLLCGYMKMDLWVTIFTQMFHSPTSLTMEVPGVMVIGGQESNAAVMNEPVSVSTTLPLRNGLRDP